jgi:hypothetical protein
MKNRFIMFFSIVNFAISSLVLAANQIVHYQPEMITLTGIIKVEEFPTPPKKECIGDKKEIYRYLLLDHSVDVVPAEGDVDSNNELQENVNDVQIVKIEDTYADSFINSDKRKHSNWSEKFVGKHLRVTGTLYSRVIRIVMIANHFEEIK